MPTDRAQISIVIAEALGVALNNRRSFGRIEIHRLNRLIEA
jgi:hypothetical protein